MRSHMLITKYRFRRVHRNAEKYFINVLFLLKMPRLEGKASFLLLAHIRNISMCIIHN